MVKLMVGKEEVPFTRTVFPDGTSQAWKIADFPEDYDEYADEVRIVWLFENEGELVTVLQLCQLLEQMEIESDHTLVVPFLPYGRQDKVVSNNTTFALETLKNVLYQAGNVTRIETFDAHSNTDMVFSASPVYFHQQVFDHDFVCFPDKGAYDRYYECGIFGDTPVIYAEKVRNQSTGEITGMRLIGADGLDAAGKSILIVDDICDGGATFVKVGSTLKDIGFSKIDLAVSHGIFSKGKQVLHDAGINEIFTTNSLLSNPDGYKIW